MSQDERMRVLYDLRKIERAFSVKLEELKKLVPKLSNDELLELSVLTSIMADKKFAYLPRNKTDSEGTADGSSDS